MEVVTEFDVTDPLPAGRLALEASAGTGKTWTIAAMVLRWVAEQDVPLDRLLVVTFTRAATAELRDRIRRRLVEAHRALDEAVQTGAVPPTEDPVLAGLLAADVRQRRDRVARALADFDAATITTIHGFCNTVLAAAGFRGEVDGSGTLVEDVDDLVRASARDLMVAGWADVPVDQQDQRPSPGIVADVGTAVLRDPDLPVLPDVDDPDLDPQTRSLVALAHGLRARVGARKRSLGLVTFDDLLVRLRDSLRDPAAGPGIRRTMQERYHVALVDEFQDTDPVQWEILQDLFTDRPLVLIGDPKQAIYRFRGADVHAYLDAVSDPATQRRTLARNFRSDPGLVAACNRLFDGTTFGDPRITHHHVAPSHQEPRLHFPQGDRPPFEVRVVQGRGNADAHRRRIVQDLAAEVTSLLASDATITDEDGTPRPVRPGDCAVLVRANAQADDVKAALADAGVHAVVNGVGSVLESPAADDWGRLLEALERPTSTARVRAVALSPVMGMTAHDLAGLDEDGDAELHERVHRWSKVLADHGTATLVRTIQRETRLAARVLSSRGGDRWLADFEHVAELLHTAAQLEHLGASALLAWLVAQRWSNDELPADQRARRLESDALAVQVLTVHRSKGLQFPIVYCPFVMGHGMPPRVPYRYQDPELGRGVVHLGGPDKDVASSRARHDDLGEQLRLLYVAMTRAEHRLVTWWFPAWQHQHSPFGKLLLNEDGDPRVAVEVQAPVIKDDGRDTSRFERAVQRLGPDACWHPVPARPTAVPWQDPDDGPGELVARRFTGRVDRTWTRSSYTALTRPVPGVLGGVVHGLDQGLGVEDEADEVLAPDVAPAAVDGDPGLPLPLGAQPAGAAFGTMVHHVLEHADFTAPDLVAELRAVRTAHRHGVLLTDPSGLDRGLAAALGTPLGPALGGGPLTDVGRADRLDELAFELPLAHRGGVTLAGVARVLEDHLPSDDPFATYVEELRDQRLARQVHGWLTGSIDLVLRRVHDDGVTRFHVVDHKTNRLFGHDEVGTTAHYDGVALVRAMRHGHYVLQSLLYQVALHRYLRWRMTDHDPERDLGAVGYLFLRGMVGPDAPPAGTGVPAGTPCGVLAWRPPTGAVVALSDLLDTGVASGDAR